jgi:hypothetical protein
LSALAACAVALVAVSVPASASALYDPILSGSAKLTFDRSFTKLLARNGVRVLGRGAKAGRRSVTTPVGGGKADPTIAKAEIELGGELIFAAAKFRVPLTDITLKTKGSPVFAKVGGGQLKVVKAASVELSRDGFGNTLTATRLRLTDKAATRLNKRLHLKVFKGGQKVGKLTAATQPLVLAVLATGRATIDLAPEFLAKLDSLSTSVNSIFPAERAGAVVSLPLAAEGSSISPDARLGTIRTAGALEFLRLGAGQIFWREPVLTIQNSGDALIPEPTISGEIDLQPPSLFPGPGGYSSILAWSPATAPAQISSDPAARTVTIAGSRLALNDSTALYFNRAFAEGAEAFKAGETLGMLTFTAQTQ